MQGELDPARMLAVIETQNEIAAMALDLDAVMQCIADRARDLTSATASVIEIPEGDEMVYRVATGAAAPYVGRRLDLNASLSGLCMREARVLHCDDTEADGRVDATVARATGTRSMICVPLSHDGVVAGVLKVMAPEPGAFDPSDVTALGLLSGVIAAHMSHAHAYALAHRQSREDVLTGLPNRRAFSEDLTAAVRVSVRKAAPLALGLFDVDRFKRVNDQHGHPVGDAVLAEIGAILAAGRAGDRAYRVGGDEFALLMPDTNSTGAATAVTRITRVVASKPVAGLAVRVSGGAAERGSNDAENLYAMADAALYDAKARHSRFGRDATADPTASA